MVGSALHRIVHYRPVNPFDHGFFLFSLIKILFWLSILFAVGVLFVVGKMLRRIGCGWFYLCEGRESGNG